MKPSNRRSILAALLLFALPPLASGALSLTTIDARAGIAWLGVAGAGQVLAPSPLLYEWGASAALDFNSSFALSPEIDLFGTQYQLIDSGTRAVPTEVEHASGVWMLGVLLDPSFRYTYHFSPELAAGITASPAFLFHIPVTFLGGSWGLSAAQVSAVTAYLYAKGRFFYPSTGLFFRWQLLPNIGLEARVRSFFPVFHLWDGSGLPFYDRLIIDGSVGLRFSIGSG